MLPRYPAGVAIKPTSVPLAVASQRARPAKQRIAPKITMKIVLGLSLLLAAPGLGQVQPSGVTRPIVEECGFNGSVVCVNKYVRYASPPHVTINHLRDAGCGASIPF
jgi:hypothetical protein